MLRMKAIQQRLETTGGVLAIVPGNDFRYSLGWSPLPDERLAILWISPRRSVLLINGVNAEEARTKLSPEIEVLSFDDAEDPVRAASTLWESLAATLSNPSVYLSDDARFDHSQILRSALGPSVAWHLASKVLAPLRMQKDPDEIQALMRSQAINDRVMQRAFEAIRPGMAETDLADFIRRAFSEEGADRDAFVIVAFGANAAHPHHTPDSTRLTHGPILLDIGCFKDGYASDMTRMAYYGKPTERYLEVHEAVERASQAGMQAVQRRAPVGDVDQASRNAIQQAGFGPYFVHRTGHGIGLEVHEPPSVTASNREPIALGMTFSIEPGIYLPDQFGVRLEDVVVVEEHRARVLSHLDHRVYLVAEEG